MYCNQVGRIACAFSSTLFMAGLLVASPQNSQPSTSTSEPQTRKVQREVSHVLGRVQSHSAEVADRAATLESLARSPQISRQTHAFELNQARDRVNEMGKLFHWLRTNRHRASPWQQQAIDQVRPMFNILAGRTEKTIRLFNENRNTLFDTAYADHTTDMRVIAVRMRKTVAAYREYGEAQQKLQQLEASLLPTRK
jgi:hypothetical protein